MSNAWLTPDDAPDGTRELVLTVPSGDEWEALARGALALLLLAANYEQHGAISPDDCAAYFADALLTTFAAWSTDA